MLSFWPFLRHILFIIISVVSQADRQKLRVGCTITSSQELSKTQAQLCVRYTAWLSRNCVLGHFEREVASNGYGYRPSPPPPYHLANTAIHHSNPVLKAPFQALHNGTSILISWDYWENESSVIFRGLLEQLHRWYTGIDSIRHVSVQETSW